MKKVIMGVFALAVSGFALVSCGSESDDTPSPVKPDTPAEGKGDFVHKIIVEDATGAWCGYCPRVAYAISEVKKHEKGKYVIPIAVHRGDSMEVYAAASLIQNIYYKFAPVNAQGQVEFGFPFALINREVVWGGSDQPNNKAAVFNKIQKSSPIGIKISSELTNTGGKITATFKFNEGYEDLRYSMYVIENGIVANQSNYTDYYGGASNLPNFVHNDVFRAAAGNVLGSVLGSVSKGKQVKKQKDITYTLINGDLSKVEVVVFISDKNGKVLNAQIAHANETTEYEMK